MTNSEQTGQTFSKLLGLAGLGIVLVLVATLVRTPAAAGYESSIYAGYPPYFWALLVVAFVLGQYIVLRGALRVDPSASHWRLGFIVTLFVVVILVFMPFFRGYPVYRRWDVLTHVGEVQKIQATGGDPFQNIYQNIHQFVLALSYATGIEPLRLINAVSGLISVFSIAASAALVTTVFDRRRALLTLPFVVALLGGSAYMNPSPYAQSVLLFPFVLYLFVKTQRVESFPMRLALTVVIVSAILYHPLTAVFLIFIFLIHHAVAAVWNRDAGPTVSTGLSRVTSTNVMQLSLVVFLSWYYNFLGIILRFETVFERLLQPGSSETELDSYSQTVSQFSPALSDLAAVGMVRYGQSALLLGIGALFVLLLLWRSRHDRPIPTPYLVTFALGFVLFVGFGVLFLLVDLIGGFGRPLVFARFFAALVAGSLLYHIYVYFEWDPSVTVAVSLLLVVLVVVSLGTLYASPLGGQSNHQLTEQELDGAQWYLGNELQTAPLQEQGIRLYRFEHALAANGTDTETVQQERTGIPDHFNYTEHPTFGDSYDENQYVVLTERGRVFYPTVYPNYEDDWRFKPDDYARLRRDPTVSRVYHNGEFGVHHVESTNETAAP